MGVDVFFVISGYLITSIILSDMDENKFSLVNFYERRARRILPALFFMMAVCMPLAYVYLLPKDMRDFSESLIAVSTFSSNILFWYESGYFDKAAELKPLLHTWSLAIEEQYYILFPLFLMLTWRLGKRWILLLLFITCSISLLATHWGSYYKPNATFYLLPTRGWEILLGGFVAFYLNGRSVQSSQPWNQLMSTIGILLIAYSVAAFDVHTPFPSLYTLIPTFGVLLIILFAIDGTLVHRLLSSRILVGVGLLSYSAYLWHQPLFAFAKHRSASPSLSIMVSLSVISLIIAYFSWRYVEKPFRTKGRFERRTIFLSACAAGLLAIGVGSAGYVTEGFEQQWLSRQSEETQNSYRMLKRERQRDLELAALPISRDNGDCRYNSQSLSKDQHQRIRECSKKYGEGTLILGDSHATDLYGVVSATNKNEPFLLGITKGGCRPHAPAPSCHYDEVLEFIASNPSVFTRVIFEQAGFYLLRTDAELGSRDLFTRVPLNDSVFDIYPNIAYLNSVHKYLAELGQHVPVLWFGSRVEPHISERDIFRHGCKYDYRLREHQYEAFLALDEAIARLTDKHKRVAFLSQNKVFDFRFPRDFMTCNKSYWTGGDHFSEAGEEYFGKRYNLLRHFDE